MLQLILHSLQKSVEKKPLDVEEVAAAAEAKVAKPNIAKVRPQPDDVLLRRHVNSCLQRFTCDNMLPASFLGGRRILLRALSLFLRCEGVT